MKTQIALADVYRKLGPEHFDQARPLYVAGLRAAIDPETIAEVSLSPSCLMKFATLVLCDSLVRQCVGPDGEEAWPVQGGEQVLQGGDQEPRPSTWHT